MGRFDDFDSMVAEFFIEFGFSATFVHSLAPVHNDTNGTVTTPTLSIPVEAIRMELIRPVEGSGSRTGTLIQDGDLQLFVRPTEKSDYFAEALQVSPNTDSFVINGKSWKIVTCKEYNPSADDCILYEFYIRK